MYRLKPRCLKLTNTPARESQSWQEYHYFLRDIPPPFYDMHYQQKLKQHSIHYKTFRLKFTVLYNFAYRSNKVPKGKVSPSAVAIVVLPTWTSTSMNGCNRLKPRCLKLTNAPAREVDRNTAIFSATSSPSLICVINESLDKTVFIKKLFQAKFHSSVTPLRVSTQLQRVKFHYRPSLL